MTSPYVRRRRLAQELRKLREDRDLTTNELARLVYQSRTKISKLENAQIRPDLADIVTLLETLDVTGQQYDKIFGLARTAARKGWWDRFGNAMGPRQRLYADLESGAETIRSYNQTAFPAVLQLPEFIDAMVELDQHQGALDYRPERMADARTRRQQHLLSPDGPTYEAVLDECMIHRLAIPPEVKATQLRHLITVVSAEDRITMRVLPSDTPIPGGFLPKASFSLYTFPDPADPPLAIIDTVTADLVLTQRHELAQYTGMYNRLLDVALPSDDSLNFLSQVANRLTRQTESKT
ncbi:XRE family transcriptional regulator [Actinomadura craniellae]|uniref:XRE family transcriptional regulator n=1 Tax=Actinomadura craniellae TaxID=2231787 RepID=A0A365H3K1_9ACTN|nr:helix-turn-helix transcriptional regulator [Actinomadura craniellae]RAY13677.1 XRE family transcriptional regulator [Actinomadura craniellae]